MMVLLVTMLTVSSCFIEEDVGPGSEGSIPFQDQQIVLGKKLENPFSVQSMRLAFDRISQKNAQSLFPNVIRPTHWYIRFLPSNFTLYDKLAADSTLHLIDHPIDQEVIQQADFYHDPSVPASQPTYQYATVPVNYIAPDGMTFEILEELYLPQRDSTWQRTDGRIAADSENFIAALEDEALQITNNIQEDEIRSAESARVAGRSSKWYPAGRITVWDNRLNKSIPVAGVKVQARNWFDVAEAITDESGYFKMDEGFRHEVNYRIVWERKKFAIRSGTFGKAQYNGPKMKGDWNLNIERNGISFHYAHVFRAAMRYYYGDIGGLKRPSFKLKYAVFNKKGNHMAKNIGNWSLSGINPNILIYRYNPLDGSENDADEVYSATCHETAHATHMEIMKGGVVQFAQVSETIRESWAIGVEWFLTQKEYKEQGIPNYSEANYKVRANYPILYGFQFWNKRRNPYLTSLFIDLVDKNNQYGQSFGRFRGTVTDPVSGYTFASIESGFLKEVYGLTSLDEKLKENKPVETSNEQIDILLRNF
jgi:hypothetical protein